MYWTKKHREWCYVFGLRPSASILWEWINRKVKGDAPEEIEIDLREFNQWVAKKRLKPYDRKTLKLAMAQLFDATEGLIVCWKQVTWYYFKIVVKPISFLHEKKAENGEPIPNTEESKALWHRSSEDERILQQQQNINQLDRVLQKVGLQFDRDALNRIWRMSGKCMIRVKEVVELMLYRHRSKPIDKPHGFIIDCLRYNWQLGFNVLYEPELPKFATNIDLVGFVDGMFAPFVTNQH